jgi:hypothetical protein
MKVKIEASDIEVSVEEALQLLRNAVDEGAMKHGICGETSSREPYFICNRQKGHTGCHIATGTFDVYEIWKY